MGSYTDLNEFIENTLPRFIGDQLSITAILLPFSLPKNKVVRLFDSSHVVREIYPLVCNYYVASGRLKIHYFSNRISSPPAVLRFIKSLGFPDKMSFVQCYFNKPEIVDNLARVNLHYHAFTTQSMFSEMVAY